MIQFKILFKHQRDAIDNVAEFREAIKEGGNNEIIVSNPIYNKNEQRYIVIITIGYEEDSKIDYAVTIPWSAVRVKSSKIKKKDRKW